MPQHARRPAHPFAVLLAPLLLVGLPSAGQAQWAGWGLYWENDSFAIKGNTDDAYTNGIRIELGRDATANLPLTDWFETNWFLNRAEPNKDATSTLVIGHNMFTPQEITDYDPDPTDRPFVGLVYLGFRYAVTEDEPLERWHFRTQSTFEFDLGMLGPAAGGHPVQSAVHSTITTHRLPKGWDHQVKNQLAASAFYMWRGKLGSDWLDIVPHGGVMMGTLQMYPFAGVTARFGLHMSGFPTALGRNNIGPEDTRRTLELGVLAGAEGRYMLSNVFVEGSRLGLGDPGSERRPDLSDFRLGAFVRIADWRVNLTRVRRSPEINGFGPKAGAYDNYGSLSISYEPGPTHDGGNGLDGWSLEAGAGGDLSSDGDIGVEHTHGMHVAIGRRIPWEPLEDLEAQVRIDGVGREFGPAEAPGDDHFDRLLINKTIGLRYALPKVWKGRPSVHASVGWSRMEYEATPPLPGPRAVPCPTGSYQQVGGDEGPTEKRYCVTPGKGTAWGIGAGYTYEGWPFDEGIGLDLGLGLNSNEGDMTRRFVAWTAGVRWTPR